MNEPLIITSTCTICAGVGYVRCELPPTHPLFGRPICCPECGRQAQLDALIKRWPVTPDQKGFGLTPFEDRAEEGDFPAVLLAWQTAYHFLAGLPDSRLLALHGKPGCGKSHLLQGAIAAAANSGLRAMYVPLVLAKQYGPDILRELEEPGTIGTALSP